MAELFPLSLGGAGVKGVNPGKQQRGGTVCGVPGWGGEGAGGWGPFSGAGVSPVWQLRLLQTQSSSSPILPPNLPASQPCLLLSGLPWACARGPHPQPPSLALWTWRGAGRCGKRTLRLTQPGAQGSPRGSCFVSAVNEGYLFRWTPI